MTGKIRAIVQRQGRLWSDELLPVGNLRGRPRDNPCLTHSLDLEGSLMNSDGLFSLPHASRMVSCASPSLENEQADQARSYIDQVVCGMVRHDADSICRGVMKLERAIEMAASCLQEDATRSSHGIDTLLKPHPRAPNDGRAMGVKFGVVRMAADLAFPKHGPARKAVLHRLDKVALRHAQMVSPALASHMRELPADRCSSPWSFCPLAYRLGERNLLFGHIQRRRHLS